MVQSRPVSVWSTVSTTRTRRQNVVPECASNIVDVKVLVVELRLDSAVCRGRLKLAGFVQFTTLLICTLPAIDVGDAPPPKSRENIL